MTLLALSLVQAVTAKPAPSVPKNEFTFVILGDSQFSHPEVYNRVIDQVALVNPSFVIQVGDMIRGYTDTDHKFRAEWSRFKAQLAPLGKIPFYPVPGNHDVMDASRVPGGANVYQETWGDLYYGFDYKNAHFTVLDTDQAGALRSVSGKQLDWLKRDLRKAQRKAHRFVFFHRPMASLKNSDALHALFLEHKVTAVIYGHLHHYHHYVQDGIPYIVTNAAAWMGTDYAEAGSFHHYLLATVRDNDFTYAIVKEGGVLPPGIVSPEDNDGLFGLNRRLLTTKDAVFDSLESSGSGKAVAIKLSNPTKQELHVYLEWELPNLRWSVAPLKGTLATLQPKTEAHSVPFQLHYSGTTTPEAYPSCVLKALYLTHDGDWITTESIFNILAKPEKKE